MTKTMKTTFVFPDGSTKKQNGVVFSKTGTPFNHEGTIYTIADIITEQTTDSLNVTIVLTDMSLLNE